MHCTGIVHALYRHCTGIVQALYRHCTCIVQALYMHCTGIGNRNAGTTPCVLYANTYAYVHNMRVYTCIYIIKVSTYVSFTAEGGVVLFCAY